MIIRPAKRICGRLTVPGDKSISHRAAMISALATGVSQIDNYATSADCRSTLSCLRELGVEIEEDRKTVTIHGVGLTGLQPPDAPLDCGNSGTTMRLMAGILAGQNFETTLTGDESLRVRPMQRIIEPLEMMGARISSSDGRAPLTVHGRRPLQAIEYELLVPSAQVKSCILLAGLYASGETRVIEHQLTRNHTELMLNRFGADVRTGNARSQKTQTQLTAAIGTSHLNSRRLSIPGDISSAAYFVAAAALLANSELEILDVGLNATRDQFLKTMSGFGANISRDCEDALADEDNEVRGKLTIRGLSGASGLRATSGVLGGAVIPQLIDELPLLAVVGSQMDGGIEIRDAKELRVKESDRIDTTVRNLRSMGACVEEFDDGLRVAGPARLQGARIIPCGDHRIVMAFAVAALLAEGRTEFEDADCVSVSFPEFFETLDSVVDK